MATVHPACEPTPPLAAGGRGQGCSLRFGAGIRVAQCRCCWGNEVPLMHSTNPIKTSRSTTWPRGMCSEPGSFQAVCVAFSVDTIQFDPLNKHLLSACSRMQSTGPGPAGGSPLPLPRLSCSACGFVPAPQPPPPDPLLPPPPSLLSPLPLGCSASQFSHSASHGGL